MGREGGRKPKIKALLSLFFCRCGIPSVNLHLWQKNHETLHPSQSALPVPIEARSPSLPPPFFSCKKVRFVRSSVGMRETFLPFRLTYEDITKYRNDELAACLAVRSASCASVDASSRKKVGFGIGRQGEHTSNLEITS